VLEVAALVTLMACSGMAMCAIARLEESRSRGNFVKEFRRRREQRKWAALISNMLPPAVVTLLQRKNNKLAIGRSSHGDGSRNGSPLAAAAAAAAAAADEDEEVSATLAWKLPHTCIFQSDIVGFTALTQRITPRELVAMLHSLFAAYDRICAKHHVQKIETIGDAYIAATGGGSGFRVQILEWWSRV
jgi:class 3 adenylate cyclase